MVACCQSTEAQVTWVTLAACKTSWVPVQRMTGGNTPNRPQTGITASCSLLSVAWVAVIVPQPAACLHMTTASSAIFILYFSVQTNFTTLLNLISHEPNTEMYIMYMKDQIYISM